MTEDDTLFEDGTGHGVDLFDGIEAEGISAAYDILEIPESDWDMGFGWGAAQLMAIEILAAAAGRPSTSQECGYFVEWAIANPTAVDQPTYDKMLRIIDRVIEKIQTEPEAFGLTDDDAGPFLAAGEAMRARVSQIGPDEAAKPAEGVRDPKTGELRDPKTGELL